VVIRDRDRGVDVYGSDTEAVIDDRRWLLMKRDWW
jgi:hypothetical protein